MNLNNLTDQELINYILKFDNDPVRIRLAKIMDRMPGFILQRLEDVGMDPETCMFENLYDPGDYITHLETEIEWRDNDIQELQEKLHERETLTVAEFIEEMLHRNRTLQSEVIDANQRRDAALQEAKRTKDKMKVWTAISTNL